MPESVKRRAGIKAGDLVEFKVSVGIISIIAKPRKIIDDEYTPEQRRIIDARLALASKGPFYGPFDTIEDLERSLRKTGKRFKPKNKLS